MFDIGSLEFLLILVIALLVIGPQRLPEIAKEVGRAIGRIKRMIHRYRAESQIDKHLEQFRSYVDLDDDIKSIKEEIANSTRPLKATADEIKEVSNTLNQNIRATVATGKNTSGEKEAHQNATEKEPTTQSATEPTTESTTETKEGHSQETTAKP